MNIKDKIIKEFPLNTKLECEFKDCYLLDKKRYLIFWDDLVEKQNVQNILKLLENKTSDSKLFSEWKTLIVVGKTKDSYKKDELLFFNNISTFVVFYLVDEDLNKRYMNDSWIFTIGLNYKKYVRKINKILELDND